MALIEFETGLSGSGNRNQQQQRLNLHHDVDDYDDFGDVVVDGDFGAANENEGRT